MHRFLYMFYDNNEDISLYTKQFKKKLNDGSSNSSCSNNSSNELFNDIIVEYLIDIKQYNKSDYNKDLALELLQQPSQLFLNYLPTFIEECNLSIEQITLVFNTKINNFKIDYENDKNFAIYVNTLKENTSYTKERNNLINAIEIANNIILKFKFRERT